MPFTPQPWNLFMSAKVCESGAIQFARPLPAPGSSVALRALVNAAVIVSSCPDDCYPTHGGDGLRADFSVVLRRRLPGASDSNSQQDCKCGRRTRAEPSGSHGK